MSKRDKNAGMYYSLHTMQLLVYLDYEKYTKYRNLLYEYCIQNKYKMYAPDNDTYCYDLSGDGITRLAMQKLTNINHEYCYYRLVLIINPRILLGYQQNVHVCILPPGETIKIIPTLLCKLQKIGLRIPSDAFRLSRLDFCTNIRLNDDSIFETYWKLLRKGRHIYHSNEYKIYSTQQKRKIAPPYSFTLCGDSFIFQLYAKEHEMLSSDYSFPECEINLSHNQIRIELRFFSNKLSKLTVQYTDIYTFMEDLPQNSQHYINKYLNAIYGKGNFMRFNVAAEMIASSPFHEDTQQAMIRFMKKCGKSSFDKACEDYKTKHDNLSYIIKCFNKIGISPIPLPVRSSYTELPHPCQYIHTHNINTIF